MEAGSHNCLDILELLGCLLGRNIVEVSGVEEVLCLLRVQDKADCDGTNSDDHDDDHDGSDGAENDLDWVLLDGVHVQGECVV